MILVSLAIDYKESPIQVRGEFALSKSDDRMLYRSVLGIDRVTHAIILSTCNRTELYLEVSDLEVIDDVLIWWQGFVKKSDYKVKDYFKLRKGSEVVMHLMKLACGLESMILGEPQILGQIKQSYILSKNNNALGKELDKVFQKVFATAKEVRSSTEIGHCPVSVAFSAISLAKKQLDNISRKNVLIIGAGKTAQLMFSHLISLKPSQVMIANRTIQRAAKITSAFDNASSHSLSELSKLLKKADIIIAALEVKDYIVLSTDVDNKSRVFIDVSVPQALDPKLAQLDGSVYYCIDDINVFIQDNKSKRKRESLKAEQIILRSLEEYLDKQRLIASSVTIKELVNKTDNLVNLTLERNLAKIKNGKDAQEVIKRFAHEIKNKVLHHWIMSTKQASKQNKNDCFTSAKNVFNLDIKNKCKIPLKQNYKA